MNSVKDTFAPKMDVIIPYGMINKPSICGASYFIVMKINGFIRTNIPPHTSGVYVIQSIVNNNGYIGSASDFNSRKQDHFKRLEEGTHNKNLQPHHDQYGKNDLWFGIIELVKRLPDEDIKIFRVRLLAREQFYIDTLKPEFNVCPTAGSPLGRIQSKKEKEERKIIWTNLEYKKRVSLKMKESHSNFSGENHPNYGKKYHAKARTSPHKNKDKKQSKEHVRKKVESFKKWWDTKDGQKRKLEISISNKSRKVS